MACKLKNTFVAQSISQLHANDDLADFTFTFGSKKVPVHRILLAIASPVFRAMFFGPIRDKVTVEITDSNAEAFKEFLQFFYLNEVTLTMENIEEVAKLADKYDMIGCLNTCAAFLEDQLTDDNMLWGYKLAISLKNNKLKQFCEKRISFHTENIFKSEAFLRCDRNVLKNILQMGELLCNEIEVLKACLSWAKYTCRQEGKQLTAHDMRTQLGECLYLIRFAAMTTEDLATHTAPYKGLLTGDEAAEIFYAISVLKYASSKFIRKPRSQWDSTKALLCQCESSEYNGTYVDEETRLRFSVNVLAVLGELHFTSVYENYGGRTTYDFVMTISEIVGSKFTVLFKGKISLTTNPRTKIPLTKALIIQPQKTYEIHLQQKINPFARQLLSNAGRWNPQYKLDDKLVVTFANINNQSGNLVSSMSFLRI